jgi:uncharacterized membrane protein YkoI
MKKELLLTMTAAALLAGCSDNKLGSTNTTAADPKVASEFNDLPPAVRATVNREVPNGVIDKISSDTKDGRVVYKIKFRDEGINPSILVAADGTILKSDISRDKALGATGASTDVTTGTSKSDLKFTQLPPAVQKTIRERSATAKVADIDKHTRNGRVVYDVSFEEKGTNPKMTIAEDGTVVKDLEK